MELTKSVFQRMFPNARPSNLDKYFAALVAGMEKYGINTPMRIAMFMANLGHESGDFSATVENLTYTTAERINKIFDYAFNSVEEAAPFVRNPQALANHVYAGRYGNGPSHTGDGWRYRGRGLIGTTFRENYEKTGKALGIDLVRHPELLEQPVYAAYSACWFWQWRGLNEIADSGDFLRVCKKINGGTNGLQDRQIRFAHIKAVMGI